GPKPQPSRGFSSVMSPRTEARRFTCRCATEVAVRDLAVAGPPSPRTPGPMGIFAEAPMYTDRMVGPFRTPRTGRSLSGPFEEDLPEGAMGSPPQRSQRRASRGRRASQNIVSFSRLAGCFSRGIHQSMEGEERQKKSAIWLDAGSAGG